jgi:Tfp pilus assembly protein PilN
MALNLNLYHEIQKQELQRRRDPLKIGIYVMVLLALGFVGYYFFRLQSYYSVKNELAGVVSRWQSAEEKQKAAKARMDELNQTIKVADAFKNRIEGRIYWAPILERIVRAVPPEIQITQLTGAVASDGSRKISVALTGVATGALPRTVAEQLRTALENKFTADYAHATSTFKSLEDGDDTVAYQGKNLPTAIFSIDLRFEPANAKDAVKIETRPKKS